ncbi:hypothetical protein Bca52824_037464 [Brassica carinata]|uniref:Uncharacterized protein n=1 Tax=Brassica carinata TaxID=52824 RepID=A0A8X7V3R0_BRACI|nr:hypothetical protein Bca52824_037464 [Brassica carinata]
MVRQAQSDINQLLLSNLVQETVPKVKQIYEDKIRLAAYSQVEYFGAFILQNFSDLKLQSDVHLLPKDTKEAIAGLIFAASRIGELMELKLIRSLFFERFGLQFDRDCIDLRPGTSLKMPQGAISPETVVETNIAASVEPVTEDSVSINNLVGFGDSDAKEPYEGEIEVSASKSYRVSRKRSIIVHEIVV